MSITENTIQKSLEHNKKRIGELVRMPGDGEWAFLPYLNGGVWTAWVLRKIADLLDEKNKNK